MRASWRKPDGVDIMKVLRLDENVRQKRSAVGVVELIDFISRGYNPGIVSLFFWIVHVRFLSGTPCNIKEAK